MHEKMLAAVVTRKWQLAQGYLAIEIETKYPTQLPPFDDGAIVDLVRHTSSNIVRSHPLWRVPARDDAFILGVRQRIAKESEFPQSGFSWNEGDEIRVGKPRSTAIVMDSTPRYILFSAGVGSIAIAGTAKRLASSGRCLEIYNFARTLQRAVFRKELDDFLGHARVCHKIGLSDAEILNAISHAVSPAQANTQIICSGPPSFMKLVEHQALDWVYPSNIHKIILGERLAEDRKRP
ncbi:ferredoxin-NADP reductase [Paraburkholderia atlantica]|uniref:hypothetical protein n=1 Tax=Paraburkholderia atlantica TaxID=2654982 RepID=UPI00037BF865|nr:hypothetical protein [Paraburkholderia atlantica]MPW08193.1 oxidoreductase [Paraburkholderia atlantica]NUY31025.1 oxidoreductase [Paraburkholderia atlantica]